MRLAGRISGWNDDKGYGFVTPNGGGDRAFVHIKAFQPGSRRAVDGDLVSYAVTRDGRGRCNAAEVRFAGQRIAQRKPARARTRIPRMLLGARLSAPSWSRRRSASCRLWSPSPASG